MSNNVVLGYLDLICRTRYSKKHSFFEHKTSFEPMRSPRSSPSAEQGGLPENISLSPVPMRDLPIHEILSLIQTKVKENDAAFFEPLILHHWQLVRLLNIVRCNTEILKTHPQYYAEIAANNEKINKATPIMPGADSLELQCQREKLHELNRDLQAKIDRDRAVIRDNPQNKENIQATLVLVTLLNVVFRKGMSLPLMSDQLCLEVQQQECKELLHACYGIDFDHRFTEVFSHNTSINSKKTVPERIFSEVRYQWNWLLGEPAYTTLNPWEHAQQYAARGLGTQDFHLFYNNFRLGGTRFRRLLNFLEPYLNNETYTTVFKKIDPYIGRTLAYINWIFFIPRLSLNFSLLYHHLFNDSKLNPLERNVDQWIRFRAHWTRFWLEVTMDSYWILISLKSCFGIVGGAFSTVGIYLSLLVQALDLFCGILRAGIELQRLYRLSQDLESLDPNLPLKKGMDERLRFELFALGYAVFHFSILTVSLCLLLPSVTAVSTIWPVVGAVCGVLMTVITFYVNRYFQQIREKEFEPRPDESSSNTFPRNNSHFVQ